jgi:hypothetical protein
VSGAIQRPNGKFYRPRKVIAACVVDADEIIAGVMILGTHDLDRAQPLADQYAAWQLDSGYAAARPLPGWYREGFAGGQLRWITDEVHGRAGVWFQEIVEVPCEILQV